MAQESDKTATAVKTAMPVAIAAESELQVVGKPTSSVDAAEKVLGAAEYLDDLSLPGMLYGKILRSPHAHARIVRIDTSAAERLPGVKAVVTHRDACGRKYGMDIADTLVMAVDRVRYVGDEIAAVAAVTEAIARQALKLINIEYEALPVLGDTSASLAEGASLLHADRPGNVARRYAIDRGDVDADFARADRVFEKEFETSMVQAAYMEPMGCIASWDACGRLTVWTSIQSAFTARRHIAQVLDLPESAVVVKVPYVGGGFGAKIWVRNLQPITALLARKAGRPVKIVLTREEEFLTMRPRVPARIRLRVGVLADGTFLTKEAAIVADNGAYSWAAPKIMLNMSVRTDCLYHWHSVRTRSSLVYTNHVPTSGFRGFGNAQMHFALESMVDIICHNMGWDPVQTRLKNASRQGDVTIHGWQLRSCALSDCIEKAAAAIRVGRQPVESGGGRIRRGIGLACMTHVSGNRAGENFDGSSALVRLVEDGSALVLTGESDLGQGMRTAYAQIAAEALGLPLASVRVLPFLDTDTSPYCLGTFSSRATTVGGKAVYLAACKLREQAMEVAAGLLKCPAHYLTSRDGIVSVAAEPERQVTMAAIAQAGLRTTAATGLEAFVCYDPPTKGTNEVYYGDYSSAYAFGAHAAEVEVDTETGFVRVLRIVAAHDVGVALNPRGVKGQIMGGVAQGLGWALTENLPLKDGVIQNPGFANYIVPTIMDMPDVQPVIAESHDPVGPYGAKGVGEPALIPSPPAIANAIFDAVGMRLHSLPLSPEKIFWALHPGTAGGQ